MANRRRIEVARVGAFWVRVDVDTDTVTEDRVHPADLPLVGLHPEFVKKMGPYVVWSIDEPSADEINNAIIAEWASLPPEAHAALEQAAMPDVRDAIIQIGITSSNSASFFPGVNEIAADYASKYALQWWPDISEPTRTNIRLIVKNAFEKKTAFSEVVDDIRAAGIFSREQPRLIPTDLRKPECPYCQNALKKIPRAKTKCSHCGQFMYVRTRPEDGARVVVTEAEVHRIDDAWKIEMIGGAREPDDLATIIAQTEIAQAQVGSNFEAWNKSGLVKSVKWLSVGPDPCPVCESNNGEIRDLGAAFPSGHVMPLAHPSCYCILQAVEFNEV